MTTLNPAVPAAAVKAPLPPLRKYTFRIRFKRAHTRDVTYHGTSSLDAREIAFSALTDAHKDEVVQMTCIKDVPA